MHFHATMPRPVRRTATQQRIVVVLDPDI